MSAYLDFPEWRVRRIIAALTSGVGFRTEALAADFEMSVDEVEDLISDTAASIGYVLQPLVLPVMH